MCGTMNIMNHKVILLRIIYVFFKFNHIIMLINVSD